MQEQIPIIFLVSAAVCAVVFLLSFLMLSLEPNKNKDRITFIKAVIIWSAVLAVFFVSAAVNRIK